MVSERLYKELVGVEFKYSSLSYGGSTFTKFLLDAEADFGTYFENSGLNANLTDIVPPNTTAGLMENASFIYRTPVERKTRIEGPVWGNFCFYLENNVTSSYKTVFTEATISLYAVDSAGTSRALVLNKAAGTTIEDVEIYPAATGVGAIEFVGNSSLHSTSHGLYFVTAIDDYILPTELLVMNLKTYGYKTSTSTTHKYRTRVGKADQDLKLALPLVGVWV